MESSPSAYTHAPVLPVARELTSSWLRRLALSYGLPPQDLLRAALSGPHPVRIFRVPKAGLELFVNSLAQTALARFAGIAPTQLTSLLPSLEPAEERLGDDVPRAAWYAPRLRWITACPPCTALAWMPRQPVLLYPAAADHICLRHRRWLLAHCRKAVFIPLQTLPEVLAAHRRHTALARTHPQAEEIVALAAAVVWSWQVQGWTGEAIWQHRTHRLASLTGCTASAVAAHALLPYPETIAVARLIGDARWQQRLRARATTAGPAAATGLLLEELGRRINRPWLSDWLTAHTRTRRRRPGQDPAINDPLQQWLNSLTHTDSTDSSTLWSVPAPATRPLEYSDRTGFLLTTGHRTAVEEAKATSLAGGWEPGIPLHIGPEPPLRP